MATTSARLRELRKQLGLSQAEFGQRIGASQGSVSKWESGAEEPRLSVLMEIGQAYGVDAMKLFLPEEHHLKTAYESEKPISIVGAVEFGAFRENWQWDKEDRLSIDLPLSQGFDLELEGYIIQDDSADEFFPSGSIIFVSKGPGPHTNLMAVYDGDIMLVTHRKGELYENVLLRNRNAKGKFVALEPITRNPEKRRLLDITSSEWNFSARGIVLISLQHLPAYKRIQDGSAAWADLLKNSKQNF